MTEAGIFELIRTSIREKTDPTGIDGLSVADIALKSGWSEKAVRLSVRKLIDEGKMECAGMGRKLGIDGVMRPVPLYRVKSA